MSVYTEGANALDQLGRQFASIIALADILRNTGSVEQAAVEAQGRLDAANAACAQAQQDLAQAQSDVADAKAQAIQIKADANQKAKAYKDAQAAKVDKVVSDAQAKAEQLVADAQSQAAILTAATQDQASYLAGQVETAKAELEAVLAQHQDKAAELEAMQKAIDQLRAQFAPAQE